MPLSADQQAMLQLVLERGQSYDDLAGVLGVGVEEVRARARAALRELGGEDPDARVGLTDYLLGQADPIGRADAARELQNDPGTNRLAATLVERLREVAPDARLPEIPEPREPRRAPAPSPSRVDSDPAAPGGEAEEAAGMTPQQQRLVVILGALAVLVVAGVLVITGAFGGGGDSESAGTTASEQPAEGGDILARIPLRPQSGGDAEGEAIFGIAAQDRPYVDVTLSRLSAPQAETSYVVWLLISDRQGYPLSPIDVTGDEFSDRIPIPEFAIPLASRARFVDVSLSENRSLLGDLRKAVQDRKPILPYQGESILRGKIPAGAQDGG